MTAKKPVKQKPRPPSKKLPEPVHKPVPVPKPRSESVPVREPMPPIDYAPEPHRPDLYTYTPPKSLWERFITWAGNH